MDGINLQSADIRLLGAGICATVLMGRRMGTQRPEISVEDQKLKALALLSSWYQTHRWVVIQKETCGDIERAAVAKLHSMLRAAREDQDRDVIDVFARKLNMLLHLPELAFLAKDLPDEELSHRLSEFWSDDDVAQRFAQSVARVYGSCVVAANGVETIELQWRTAF